ncbi:pantoate kinase [Halococcus sp. IIIV-5B]|uniref:pantoate kinase n=1 Tax=Halococcus sp. IIIV-5B TaxID=2321230 RepID=UPI000E719CDB|nr:pantoate kinase [Halococcus sp. IIIV-5B]RJT01444.1 sugar kinase [Halococcus sp. IIIV-5B]
MTRSRARGSATTDRLRAFVPGHVTGFFSVHRHEDPRKTGSRGVGLALTDGVTVELVPADEPAVVLDGDPIEMEAVTRTLDALGVTARAVVETSVPVSAGFGVSGGAALGTALVANAADGLALTENELVGVAHAAEVEAGTGLGDVVAQARGGVPVRLAPGAPAVNRLDGLSVPETRIEYVSFGGRSTDEIIGGDVGTLSAAGERALDALLDEPTLPRALALSRSFAIEADLLTPPVEAAIEAVRETGGEAAMAMLGDTVIALGDGLSAAGYDPVVCEVDPCGARLV